MVSTEAQSPEENMQGSNEALRPPISSLNMFGQVQSFNTLHQAKFKLNGLKKVVKLFSVGAKIDTFNFCLPVETSENVKLTEDRGCDYVFGPVVHIWLGIGCHYSSKQR